MKILFFTGKGGVGKSTLSAATAWQLSQMGYRVLAVSFDPAHNLGDIFGVKLTHKKKKFTKNLYLQEIDLDTAASEYVKTNVSLLTEVYGYLQSFNMDKYFKVLRFSPGIEEYAALTALEKILRNEVSKYDYLVIDTPPTGLTLRMLALPRITLTWVDQLIRLRKEILNKRYTIHNLKGKYEPRGVQLAYKEEDDPVIRKLFQLREKYSEVNDILQGEENSVVLVFNPDYLSLRESERLIKGLKDLQLPLRAAFNNKVLEDDIVTALEVETKLLSAGCPNNVERIPLIPHNGVSGYLMNRDLTVPFLEKGEN
jgi:arsenite-transporting ATPase